MRSLTLFLFLFIFSLMGCSDDVCQKIHEEINACKVKSIKSSSDLKDLNDRIESISIQINELDKKKYSIDEILELKREAEALNNIRSKELIKFISMKITTIKNSNDPLNALSLLNADISMNYSMLILDDDRIQLNQLNEEITQIKEAAELELKWTEWKKNLRTALKEKIDEEWKMYISNKNDMVIATINYDFFDIDFKTNTISNSSKEKSISIPFSGKLKTKIEPRLLRYLKQDAKIYEASFNGTYNSKCTIGNEPYLENVNIYFTEK